MPAVTKAGTSSAALLVWGLSAGFALFGAEPAASTRSESDGTRAHKDAASLPEHQQQPQPAEKQGLFPKALRIPGTDVFVTFGGYAKVDYLQDLDAIGDAFEFKVNSIPVEGTAAADQGGRTTISARETRFNVDFRSDAYPAKFRAFFEGDFFGDNNAFRMRHAYGEVGPVLGGQTWTTFMDVSARPLTVDFEGPDAEVFVRQALIRYTRSLAEHWTWAIAVENPTPQFVVPDTLDGSPSSERPDVPTYFRYAAERGHVQIAGVLRQIRFDGELGSPDLDEIGWGVNGTFRFKVYKQDEVMGQVVHGEGIARYIESLSGQNVDALITPADELQTIPVSAAVIGYTHHWSAKLQSGIAYGLADLDTDPLLPAATIARTEDARVNLIHTPYPLLDYGVEALWGSRENQDGAEGTAWRVHFAITFHFN